MKLKKKNVYLMLLPFTIVLLTGCPEGKMSGEQLTSSMKAQVSQETPEVQRLVEEGTNGFTSIDPNNIIAPFVEPRVPCDNTDATATEAEETLVIQPKSQWGGRPVEPDASFQCMDYQSMAPAMGYPANLSEEDLLKRVYQGGRIVIHHTANNFTAQQNQSTHIESKGLQDLAYHFYITANGDILEGRPLTLMGAHAGTLHSDHYTCDGEIKVASINRDYDFRSIGIVLQGNYEEAQAPERQYQALKQLVASLSSKYNIEKMNGHNHYRVGATACPGQHLFNRLQNDSDIKLESDVDKTTNPLGPDFICRYPSGSCR